ncbi:heavy metal translocating P-type ATPase [Leptospira perolatii]
MIKPTESSNTQDSTVTLDLYGMTCANCALRIEKGLNKLNGVEDARVNFAMETAYVKFNTELQTKDLIEKVKSLGYNASEHLSSSTPKVIEEHVKEKNRLRFRFISSAILAFPLFYTMASHFSILSFLPVPEYLMHPWVQFLFAAPVQFWIGFPFYKGAFRALKNGSANMDVLVALGTSAAFGYSFVYSLTLGLSLEDPWFLNQSQSHQGHGMYPSLYYETSAVLLAFLLAGKWMEAIARGKSSQAIQALLGLRPDTVRIKKDSEWIEVPLEFLKEGDLIQIRPGERIPTDGIVLDGSSSVDESMLTGESLPVQKVSSSKLFGGTMNGKGGLIERADKVGQDTVLSSIIKTVEEAQASRAPLQRIADKISAIFVPSVVVIAVLDFLIWSFFIDFGNLSGALEKSIAVLVIACPCALGLATPVSLLVGTGKGATMGILFRNAESLETVSSLEVLAFDKTGTLTEGKPRLTAISVQGDEENNFLRKVASVESSSEHPLGAAIVAEALAKSLVIGTPTKVVSEPGGGIRANLEEDSIVIGKKEFLEAQGVSIPKNLADIVNQWELSAKTVVWAAIEGGKKALGILALEDSLKSSSIRAVQKLRELGLELVLLTGDHLKTAEAVAAETGIQKIEASLNPNGKAAIIQAMQIGGKKVGMAGDGMNDAPALAVAQVGFAMGNGTDIAMESAGVVLVKGDLLRIWDSIRLSRATVRNIRQNLFWALAYNAIGIPIAALGYLAPWLAGAAMALSSVSVVTNALRLRNFR